MTNQAIEAAAKELADRFGVPYLDTLEAIRRHFSAPELSERLKGLRAAYEHHQAVQDRGDSTFIKENGRRGGSPWRELMDAIESVLGEPSDELPMGDTTLLQLGAASEPQQAGERVDELTRLREDADAEKHAEHQWRLEKRQRIYYQDIVYECCRLIDKAKGWRPGQGIVCGTADTLRELGIGLYEAWGLCQEAGLLPPNFRWTWMEVRVRDLLCGDDYLLDDMMEWERDSLLAWRSRSNCDRCFYARQYEKVGLLEHHPPRFFAAVDMERRLGHKGFTWHSDYSLPSLIPRAAEIKEKRARAIVKFLRTKQQRYLFADDDSQPDELAVTSCGLLCGK